MTATQDFRAPRPFLTAQRDAHIDLGALTVPYSGQTRMRLTVADGMADARIRVDPEASDLISIECGEDIEPRLRVSSSELRVSWPETIWSQLYAALVGDDRDVEIVLHPAVEWTLYFRGGLSRVEADLTAGKLAAVEIKGGASDVRFDLPVATDVVPIRIAGGASELGIRRPGNLGIALAVAGGISSLLLDDQDFAAIGGRSRLSAGLVQHSTPHYALEIGGGASDLQIVAR